MSTKKKVNIKKKEKEHLSMFLLTINSNSTTIGEEDFETELYSILEQFDDFIDVNSGHHRDGSMEIQLSPQTERGSLQGRLHAHIVVSISHNSYIRINAAKIRAACPVGWHVDDKYIKGSSEVDRAIAYTKKNLGKK